MLLWFKFDNELNRAHMPSLIQGYEYDIFISYRQKDNKHDGWVTEFVDNLKGELESTFKEEISVYFDINPHDGLLETHDVDASLKDKLKCLIFIPIISRTYCDPKSFAWEHEFKAFVEQASQDKFGLKVKLPYGNVANRVLPVRIYDLDTNDIKLCESILGGVLRSVDFIYKSAGVNRPLRANEDHPQDNLNKTYYLDQVNKVANSMKEIIASLGHYEQKSKEVHMEKDKPIYIPQQNNKTKIIAGSLILLALIVFGYFVVPKLFKPSAELEKSIAVLPFFYDSPDNENTLYINGIMSEILNNLSKLKDLSVRPRTSVEKYRNQAGFSAPQIGKELNVSYLVEGRGQKYGNMLQLTVQLIDAAKNRQIWTKSYEEKLQDASDLFALQSQVARAIATEMKTIITQEEKQLIEKTATTDLTAYYFYQKAREEHLIFWLNLNDRDALVKARTLYKEAIKHDSTFAQAYSGLALLEVNKNDFWRSDAFSKDYLTSNYLDSVLILADRALTFDSNIAEAYYVKGLYYWATGNEEKALENIDNALKYNPNDARVYEFKGFYYYIYSRRDMDYIKAIENLKKAISINHGKELPEMLNELGLVYSLMAGFPEEGKKCFNQAFLLSGDSAEYLNKMGRIEMDLNNFDKAIDYLTREFKIDSTSFGSLEDAYIQIGRYREALKYYIKDANRIKADKMISPIISHRIGYAYWKNGDNKEADYWFNEQQDFCEQSIKRKLFHGQISLTAYYDLACVYAFRGNKQKAYENLHVLEKLNIFPEWWLVLIKTDPLLESLRGDAEFQRIVDFLKARYQKEHERVGKWLEEQGMLSKE